jgi:hypothetical protein
MRRWFAAVALLSVAAITLSGCGKPAGVDGSITDDWAAIGEPKPFVPAEGTCHASFKDVGYLSGYQPIECTTKHEAETVHVGTFSADVEASAPPVANTAAMRTAYAECETSAKQVLGDDWRGGRTYLGIVLPSTDAWAGGARWFRCDLMETVGKDDSSTYVSRSAPIKGTLSGDRALAYSCYVVTLKNNSVDQMKPTACNRAHNGEFAGIYTAPEGEYKTPDKTVYDAYHKACRGVVARWANVPNDGNTAFRYGTIVTPLGRTEWERGNRGVLCHIWLDKKSLTRSLKGAGTGALPIN